MVSMRERRGISRRQHCLEGVVQNIYWQLTCTERRILESLTGGSIKLFIVNRSLKNIRKKINAPPANENQSKNKRTA